MKLTKKLSQLGATAYGLVLTQELLAQLGFEVSELNSTNNLDVILTFYGDTLIVRRADAPPPTPAEVAYFLTDDLGIAKHFPMRSVTSDQNFLDQLEDSRLRLGVKNRGPLPTTFGQLYRDGMRRRAPFVLGLRR